MELVLKYLEHKSGEDGQNVNASSSFNLTSNMRGKPVVKEWGLSHTSLEDVFLEVTKRENFTYLFYINFDNFFLLVIVFD